MRRAPVIVIASIAVAGCGGGDGDGPTAEQAEDHVTQTLADLGDGVDVENVSCEEQEGEDQFLCDVDLDLPGDVGTQQVTVDFDELE